MAFKSDRLKTGYFLYLIETLFFFTVNLSVFVFFTLYYFNNVFARALKAPVPFYKFAILYFLVFCAFAFFFAGWPIQKKLFSLLEIYKRPPDLSGDYEALKPLAISALKRHGALGPKNDESLVTGAFVTFMGDYYVILPYWFVASIITLLIEIKIHAASLERFYGFDFSTFSFFFTIFHFGAAWLALKHYNPAPGSIHKGFSCLLTVSFIVRTAFFIFAPGVKYHALTLTAFAAVLLFKYSRAASGSAYYHVFIRTKDRNIWSLEYNAGRGQVGECVKLDFGLYLKFVRTPFSFGFVFDNSPEPGAALEYGRPYYIGADGKMTEDALGIFYERTGPADVRAKRDVQGYQPEFIKLGISDFSYKYGVEQFAVTAGFFITTFLLCYELFKAVFSF